MIRATAIAGSVERGLRGLIGWAARSGLRRSLVIGLVALVMLAPGTATLPVTDRDEGRFVQASKQMLETGDPIDIRFQDKPRWKKPAGIYWLQAGNAALFAGSEAPVWAYRLPSLLAGILGSVLLGWAVRPAIGAEGAVLAGLMLPAVLLVAVEANIAKTDAALMATGIAVFGGMVRLLPGVTPPGAWTSLSIWAALAAALLLKGPIVPAIAILALVWLWIACRRIPPLGRLRPLPGLALTLALAAPWFVAIWIVSDGAFFARSVGDDLLAKIAEGQEKHGAPPGLYLALVWGTFWPWAALLIPAAPWIWRMRRTPWLALAAGWVIPFWIVLEAVPTKLPHYVLPLYPVLLTVIAAWAVAPDRPQPSARSQRISSWLVLVPGAGLALATIALPLILEGNVPPLTLMLAPVAAAALWLAHRAALANLVLGRIGASLVAAAALYPAALQASLPALDTAFPSPRLAEMARPWQPCASGPLVSAGYREPSLVFHVGTDTRLPTPEETVRIILQEPGALMIVVDRWMERHIRPALGPDAPDLVERGKLRYFNYNRGSFETARLLTRAEPRWDACAPPDTPRRDAQPTVPAGELP